MEAELTFGGVMKVLDEAHVSESRTKEFYAASQLIALGELSADEQKKLGGKLVKMIETDHWWRSNGAFNDE